MPEWDARPSPSRTPFQGSYCRLEPLDPHRHAEGLHAANQLDREGRMWTYMPYGPFSSFEAYREWMESSCMEMDPLFYAVVDRAGDPVGLASYLRIQPDVGVIEVGHIAFAPSLQRTVAGTEAMYLMMQRAFDELGYRRYEWKCDALNRASRAAAERLGFTFEGVFRQATMYKGRNRDTAWYSVVDHEWPALRSAFELWLEPANFDESGRQRRRLEDLR